MGWHNPFSFRGGIGRARFLLFIALAELIMLPGLLLPVSGHEIRLSPPHGMAEEMVSYATPLAPASAQSWAYLMLFYALNTAGFWIMFAAIVRRMHDLDRDIKWLIVVVAVFAVHLTLEALFSRPDAPFSIFEFANLALLAPAAAIAAYGMLEMLLVRGSSSLPQRSAGDMRGAET